MAKRLAAPETERKGSKWWLIPVVALVTLGAVYLGVCVVAAKGGTVYPNVYIADQLVGGLTEEEAARYIAPYLDRLDDASGVYTTFDNGTETAFTSYADLGVRFDAAENAKDAYESGRTGSFLIDGLHFLRAQLGEKTVLAPQPNGAWDTAAQRIAAANSRAAADFDYTVQEDGSLVMTKPSDGLSVDRAALKARLAGADGDDQGTRTVTVPYSVVPAEDGDLSELLNSLAVEKADAYYDKSSASVVAERWGVRYDEEEARRLLSEAEPGDTVTIPAIYEEPDLTAEALKAVLFRDVLGSYTTRVSGSEGRRSNVRLVAKRVNGSVMNSGENFDYLSKTAPYSQGNGYQLAPGYLNGKTVMNYGGGVCQGSSTIYAAALHANLEIVKRTPHGFASDYIGLGLDATVSDSGPEFVFRNNTAYPIKLEAVYGSDNTLTIRILGTKTNSNYVKMVSEVISTTPFSERVIETTDLAPGVRRVEQTPYTGYVVKTYRNIYSSSGTLISSTYETTSTYKARDRIVYVGAGTPAPAETTEETAESLPAQETVSPTEQTLEVAPSESAESAPAESGGGSETAEVTPVSAETAPVEPESVPVETGESAA